MAKMQPIFATTGLTLYGVLLRGDQAWNGTGAVYEALDANVRSQYAITLTETPASSGIYVGDVPASGAFLAGKAHVLAVYEQAGGSPATSDTRNQVVRDIPVTDVNVTHVNGEPADLVDPDTLNRVTLGSLVAANKPANNVGSPLALSMHRKARKTFSLTVLDADDNPVDLTDATLRFVVFDADVDPATPIKKAEGGDITISGTSNEIAQVTLDPTDSDQTPKLYTWVLWDTRTGVEEVLLHGTLAILPAVFDVA